MNHMTVDAVDRRREHAMDRAQAFLLRKGRSRFWALRAAVCGNIFITCLIACVSVISLNRFAFIGMAGIFGWCAIALLMGLALGGIADVIVNDLAPDRYRLRVVREYRWLLFMVLALTLGVFAYAAIQSAMLRGVLFRFFFDASLAMGAAILDLMERSEAVDRRVRNE